MSLAAAANDIADKHPALIRLAAIGLAVLSLSLVANTLYKNRGRFERSDFNLYYAWWVEYRVGIDPFRPAAGPAVPNVHAANYCNYTPAFMMLFSPMARFQAWTAYRLWLAIQIAALMLALVMLLRQIRPPPRVDVVVAIVALAMLFPQVHATLYEAQFTFILMLMMVASWVSERRGRPVMAGLMLAVAALLKVYPATLGGLFLFRGRFRPIIWAAVFTIVGVVVTGLRSWYEFFAIGVPVFNSPHWYAQPRAVAIWCNVMSALLKLNGGVPPKGFGLPVLGLTAILDLAVIAGASAVTFKAREDVETDGLCFGLWLTVALLISPVTWLHELPLLLPLYIFAGTFLLRGGIDNRAGFGLAVIALVGLVSTYFWTPLRELRLYFIMTVSTYLAACMLVASRSTTRRVSAAPMAEARRATIPAGPELEPVAR